MSTPLTRRSLLASGVSAAALAAWPWRTARASSWDRYAESIVIDGLGAPGSMISTPPLTAEELKDVRDSGLTCLHITIGPIGTTAPETAFVDAVANIGAYERAIDREPQTFGRVRTTSDVVAAKRARHVGIIYGVQDAVAFETQLDRLDDLHRLGLRVVQPTYNRRNLLGDGCLEPSNAGLSIAGVEAIERLNKLGMLIDLSHCGRRTSADAIRLSKMPVAFTHTGCAAIADHPRNRTDAELRAVADKGGVNGIYFMPYLCGGRQPTAADVIRHLEHMLQVAGEDHVSIGTDGGISPEIVTQAYRDMFAKDTRERLEAGIAAPQETEDGFLFAADLNTPRRLETLASMLAARGHRDSRIEKIMGLNLMRVLGEVWRN